MKLSYRLVVLTHGGDENTPMLRDTLAAFDEMVTPSPAERWLIEDGPPKDISVFEDLRVSTGALGPYGFCAASAVAWGVAGTPGVEFVYWLEHDFKHTRPVSLEHLALVLKREPTVAQMSLMRQPVNEIEKRFGGIVASKPFGFLPRHADLRGRRESWLEHGEYWTTNPCLFRSETARAVEWPTESECEGKLTIRLRALGYSFGVWGAGEEWVEHVGVRTGFGY